jgi:hypothetical protein
MAQNGSWDWLLEGFKFDLETEVRPRMHWAYDGRVTLDLMRDKKHR